jgi:hypothetical protein
MTGSALLPDFCSWIRLQVFNLPFNLIEQADLLPGILSQLTLVSGMQIKEFTPATDHAADLGNALFETFLVAGEVTSNQLALPRIQDSHGMLTRAIRRKVIGQ